MATDGHPMETRTRTLAKALTWQILGLFTMSLLSWLNGGSAWQAVTFAFSAATISLVLFFFHERLWGLVRWGRSTPGAH